ncbi:Gfo/Idh/MocA family oxidoreductase [Thermopolyspora sp. NPDC052614]|uniref:Gfo/Idh/MocA family protein n=1 Tax=Thermopolyspora sp. NPDC052614 TaxID=3155682 RepID=UPI003432EE90
MAVRVGVIGTGTIGRDHIRRLTRTLSGSRVVAVNDIDAGLAEKVAARLPGDVRTHGTADGLIADDAVDAVVVCSWGPAHAEQVLAAVAAGKPVFCEKPLATTRADCLRIVEAEVAAGRRLVRVGYMRRYDPAYRELKRVVDAGAIGAPLMMHCVHRNAGVPAFYEPDSTITDTAVHEMDVTRWMFGEEITTVTVLRGRRNRHSGDIDDPLLVLLQTESGILVDVEISVNIRYGYDIRCEVVGEDGTAALGDTAPVTVRLDRGITGRVPADYRERFAEAYDREFQSWLDELRSDLHGSGHTDHDGDRGPSAWDGYAASAVSDATLTAARTGSRIAVQLAPRPALYG